MIECKGVYRSPLSSLAPEVRAAHARALFLDRDGVINMDRGYVHQAQETVFVSGIFELCAVAHNAGLLLIVITNQAGIARGLYSEEQFLQYTAWMHGEFAKRSAPLLATYYCPHHPAAGFAPYLRDCDCRKPKPGMLLRAEIDYDIDMPASILVGDQDSDIAAAHAARVGIALKPEIGGLPAITAWLRSIIIST